MIQPCPHPHTKLTGAIFSPCAQYRYRLWRYFREAPERIVNFIMLNPSTADEITNDPTIERCSTRVRSWGFHGLVVTNLFAWRSTSPAVLRSLADPIGPENNQVIRDSADEAELVVCAWGKDGSLRDRGAAIRMALLANFPQKVTYLRMTKSGHPEHPLYVPYEERPKLFTDGSEVLPLPEQQTELFAAETRDRTVEAL